MKKKKVLIIGAVAVLVIGLIVGLCAIIVGSLSTEIQARTAIVLSANPEESTGVSIEREEQSSAAYAGMRLKAGDAIVTDADSMVTIRIDNDKDILLGKSSRMEITSLEDKKLVLTLVEGEFFFSVNNKLSADEIMLFKIGVTSMSIRGTSGGGYASTEGEAQFMIITGKGEIQNDEAPGETQVTLLPQTKTEFSSNTGYEKGVSVTESVTSEDFSETMTSFVAQNEEYVEILTEAGWEIEGGEIVSEPEVVIDPNAEESGESTRIGWRQRGDETWYFSQEDYDAGIGPTAYVWPEKPVYEGETVFTADGAEKQIVIDKFDEVNMTITGDKATDIGHYQAVISPIYHWADGTADPVIVNWSIVPASVDNKVYNGTEQVINPIGYNPETMTIAGNKATHVGSYTISIAPLDGAWADGSSEAFEITWAITPIYITISDTDYTRTFDGSTGYEAVYNGNANRQFKNDGVYIAVKAENFPGRNAGTYADTTVSYTLVNNNHNDYILNTTSAKATIKIDPKPVTLTGLTALSKVYDGTKKYTATYNVQFHPALAVYFDANDSVSIAVELECSSANVGTYQATITLALVGDNASNYTLTEDCQTTVEVKITQKPVTIGFNVTEKTITYGDYLTDISYDIQGSINGDTFLIGSSINARYLYPVGNYTFTPSVNEANYLNYSFTYKSLVLHVQACPVTLEAESYTKTYGDDDPTFALKTAVFSDGTTFSYTIDREEGEDVDEYTLTPSVTATDYPNFIITLVPGTLTIEPKAITGVVNDASKTYGDSDPIFTVSFDGVLSGDTISGTFSRAGGDTTGRYAINYTVDDSVKNYDVTITSGTLTINQRTVTIAANDVTAVYGEYCPNLTYTVCNALQNEPIDEADISMSILNGENLTVGSYTIVVSVISTYYPNYNIVTPNGTLMIIPLDVSCTFEVTLSRYVAQVTQHLKVGDEELTSEDLATYGITHSYKIFDSSDTEIDITSSLSTGQTYMVKHVVSCSNSNITINKYAFQFEVTRGGSIGNAFGGLLQED